jgi:hypothetical protein
MKIKLMLVAVMTLVVLNGTKIAVAGGDVPIPLAFSKWHGLVEIKPLSADCRFQTTSSAPERKLSPGWQRIQKGMYLGNFQVRTGKHSWAQVNYSWMCVESNSLLTTDGPAGTYGGKAIVHRGKVTAVDGKPGPHLPESSWLHYATKP